MTDTATPILGTPAGDTAEWMCEQCRTIHPRRAANGLSRFYEPCPDCRAPMMPTSPNTREIARLRALVAEAEATAEQARRAAEIAARLLATFPEPHDMPAGTEAVQSGLIHVDLITEWRKTAEAFS